MSDSPCILLRIVMIVSLIVAMTTGGIIGREGDLPWRLSSDLKRFKKLTTGHAIVMGRKTWESIGRPLPGRESIVLTRRTDYTIDQPHVHVAATLAEAIAVAESLPEMNQDELFIIGGGEIYRQALPIAKRIYLTHVMANVAGDTKFPEVDWSEWSLLSSEAYPSDDQNDYPTQFEVWNR